MNVLKASISGVILLLLIFALHTRFGSLPPLGKFFDPQSGFWPNAETASPGSEELNLQGLKEEVTIYFDERRIPHIFANNAHDLYYAQGYVTARDRLFQMELQTYDAAGRLSELLGVDLLERDLYTRRIGMAYGAEKALERFKQDPETYRAIQAYSDGVNALISSLTPDQLPLEYKILNMKPESWEPLKTAQFLKNMTRSLAGRNNDVVSSNTRAFFGDDYIAKFFNQKPEKFDPIIPTSRKWDFNAEVLTAPDSHFTSALSANIDPYAPHPNNGSNNWAVSGEKTQSGYPILSNDPHLNMTLPSIWYEIQLSSPEVNVYGASLPGTPAVIVGFNEDVAWGLTNTGSDVMDWYEITFKDETKAEYWHDGEWKPTSTRIEKYKVRRQEAVLDTIIFTHHGPVMEVSGGGETGPIYHALRWIAHEPSNDLKTFIGLNRAENYDDYKEALTHYMAPAQNFAFASRDNDIALWVNGKLPKKWKYQGREVSDGSDAQYDWQGWIPREQNPWVKNPPRNFVSSANQASAGEDYPYYLDDRFAPYERGRRINERLAKMENITKENMQALQMDSYSYHAESILPFLLGELKADSLNEVELQALDQLKKWDFVNNGDEIAPSVFKEWWNRLIREIFMDEYASAGKPLRIPPRDRLVEVIKEERSFKLYDNIETSGVIESRSEVINHSYRKAIVRLEERFGAFGENWSWAHHNQTDISHIARIPGLGKSGLFTDGGPESINAISGSHGPSWRMVVELGPDVKGWGVLPGGASGNPGSANYDASLETWRTGELHELNFMRERPAEYFYSWKLLPHN